MAGWLMNNDMKACGNGQGIIRGTAEPTRTSGMTAGLRVKVWSQNLPITNQDYHPPDLEERWSDENRDLSCQQQAHCMPSLIG
jgi:hypothetical protein